MTVREPAQLVLANVHYHLTQGADEVHVFLDDPGDPVAAMLAGVARCHVHLCDAAHWERLNKGQRPVRQTRRQAINATSIYKNTDLDWLIHLDADEFVHQVRPLEDELAHAPRRPSYIALPVRERVFEGGQQVGLFDGAFRVPFQGRGSMMRPLFGDLTPFLNKGVAGHSAGKACVPVGRKLRMSVHAPRTRKGETLPPLHATSSVLLHFDGLTRLHWMVKMLRYAVDGPEGMVGPHRMAQLAAMEAECDGLKQIAAFHDRLKSVDSDEEARLAALGLLEHLPFDVGDQARAAVAAAGLTLDAAAFDADLRARNSDLLGG